MNCIVSLSRAVALAGVVALSSAPAHARSCTDIGSDIETINREMRSVAAEFPGTTAGLATCLVSALGAYGDGNDGPGPALVVGGGCVLMICWMSGVDNCFEVATNYFSLGFRRSELETEADRNGCPK